MGNGALALVIACAPATSAPEPPAVSSSLPSALPAPLPVAAKPSMFQGLSITLELPKRRWFLGENILLHYVVTNVSDAPVTVEFGGDYRGSSRHRRFRVVVTDAKGNPVEDPDRGGHHFGGLGAAPELAPGQEHAATIALQRYCRFEVGGLYRVRVAHDLGVGNDDGPLPPEDGRWVEAELELVMPSAGEARGVLEAALALPSDANAVFGKRTQPFPDLTAMSHAVYLPLLEDHVARLGEARAVWGIAAIPTPAATQSLVRLAEDGRAEVAAAARSGLLPRLPKSHLPGEPSFEDLLRDYFVKKAWQPTLADEVRALGRRLLLRSDDKDVLDGALLMQELGVAADFDIALKAADRAFLASKSSTLSYPRPRTTPEALLRTLLLLVERGAPPPVAPKTPGEIALYVAVHGKRLQRPSDYVQLAADWLDHDLPMLRFLVLERSVPPHADAILKKLPAALESPHMAIAVHACEAMEASGDKRFRAPISAQLKKARDPWLLRSLARAAPAVGLPRDELVTTWVERLHDTELTLELFRLLGELIEPTGGSGMSGQPDAAEAQRLQKRWRRFVSAHRAAIRAGKRFTIGGPELTADLIPKGFKFHRKNQPDWPE